MNAAAPKGEKASLLSSSIHSIGHSNQPLEHFTRLLRQSRIETVADIRSEPHSRFSPHFDRERLRSALQREGIRYVFLGKALGGRPAGEVYYDSTDRVCYDRVAESQLFRNGIQRLREAMATSRVAIMCTEEDPRECHRYLLVSRVLEGEGVQVRHIRGDGRIQSAAEIEEEAARRRGDAGQLMLFGPMEEAPWRSTRSVSRRKTRPTSSGR
jgi:uncharacterized protein (DUF488 family)